MDPLPPVLISLRLNPDPHPDQQSSFKSSRVGSILYKKVKACYMKCNRLNTINLTTKHYGLFNLIYTSVNKASNIVHLHSSTTIDPVVICFFNT